MFSLSYNLIIIIFSLFIHQIASISNEKMINVSTTMEYYNDSIASWNGVENEEMMRRLTEVTTEPDVTPTSPWYIWLLMIYAAMISFWFQATITEERFVPALTVIANYFNMPNDIAGATLMAAGASAPELFSSFVALFITHSSLGLGTIVGSEIFNQLCICAGSIYASQDNTLILDPYIVIREVTFYGISIIVLYLALQDSRPDPDDPSGVNHIYISFYDALLVLCPYVLYVMVFANMEPIEKFFGKNIQENEKITGDDDTTTMLVTAKDDNGYGAISSKPKSNRTLAASIRGVVTPGNDKFFIEKSAGAFQGKSTSEEEDVKVGDEENDHLVESQQTSAFEAGKLKGGHLTDGRKVSDHKFIVTATKPSDEHSLYDIQSNPKNNTFSCFMWQRSYFYSNARRATNGWHLRWFTINLDDGTMYSVPNRYNGQKFIMKYPAFVQIEIDIKRQIIRIIHPSESSSSAITSDKNSFYLLATSNEVMAAMVDKLEELMEIHEQKLEQIKSSTATSATGDDELLHEFEGNSGEFESLVEYPEHGSMVQKFFFVFLYPYLFLLHYTIPDVRQLDQYGKPTASILFGTFAAFMCLFWMIIASLTMVSSLEGLAALMDIPDAIVGVTVSAAGTSLPNYVGSLVAAQKGFGNMAVSNAFGSNTFNIMIGLGLPWLVYTSFQPYHGLKDDGITQNVIILGSVLLVFVVNVVAGGFVLYKWNARLYVLLYLTYLGFNVYLVYG